MRRRELLNIWEEQKRFLDNEEEEGERLQIGQNEEFSNGAENLVSEAVKRRGVHLESEEKLL